MVFIISLAVAGGLVLICVGTYQATQADTSASERLHAVSSSGGYGVSDEPVGFQRKTEGTFIARFLLDLGNWYQVRMKSDEQSVSATKLMLSMAGWRSSGAVAIYSGAMIVSAAGLGGIVGASLVAAGKADKSLGLGMCALVVGFLIPRLLVNHKVKKRQESIMRTVPDVIDMLILCVESGLGLNTAIKRVADERCKLGADVMGLELRQMTHELQAGRTREDSFRDLAERNGVDELKSLSAFMIQSEKLGTNVADALRIYADESRVARRQRASEMANKAAVKLLFPLVLFIFPTMFLVILGPAMMSVKANLPG